MDMNKLTVHLMDKIHMKLIYKKKNSVLNVKHKKIVKVETLDSYRTK